MTCKSLRAELKYCSGGQFLRELDSAQWQNACIFVIR